MNIYIIKYSKSKKNIILRCHGKDEAAIVSIEDLEMLNGIKTGLEQVKQGKTIPHEEAMYLVRQKLGHL